MEIQIVGEKSEYFSSNTFLTAEYNKKVPRNQTLHPSIIIFKKRGQTANYRTILVYPAHP